MIDFETAEIRFVCEDCLAPDRCDLCGGLGYWWFHIGTLFANLYAVGCVDIALNLGRAIGYDEARESDGYRSRDPWRPNTDGRAVPMGGE